MTNKQKVYNPKLNTIENYKGPYSVKCLMRTRQVNSILFNGEDFHNNL